MARISELAAHVGLPFEGDGDLEVRGVMGLDTAGEHDLTFVRGEQNLSKALSSPVRAVVAEVGAELPGKTVIRSPFPHLTVVELTPLLHPTRQRAAGIDPRAVVGEDCLIDPSAVIYPLVSIGDGVMIGARTVVHPGTCVGDGVTLGADCLLHPNVTVGQGCQVGDRVIIHSSTVIGSDGFGYLQHEGRHVKIPHLGIVVLEDDVELGGGCAIDRGTYGPTTIGKGAKLDNLVHIAHNVQVGEYALLAGQVGIAGSTKVGKYVRMAGQSGVLDHMSISAGVTVGPKSVMTRPGDENGVYYGYPARPYKDWQRSVAYINGLEKLTRRVKKLWDKSGEQD